MSRLPESLCEFLAAKGGIRLYRAGGERADGRGELLGMNAELWHRAVPFRRRLVRDDAGMHLDRAREAADEAGYIRDPDGFGTTVADLLDAIDRELSGQPVYSWCDEVALESALADERANIAVEDDESAAAEVVNYERPYVNKKGRPGVPYYSKVLVDSKPVHHKAYRSAEERAADISAFLSTLAPVHSGCPF